MRPERSGSKDQVRRGAAIAARKRALIRWDKANPGALYDPELFRRDILPRLAGVKLSEIVEAIWRTSTIGRQGRGRMSIMETMEEQRRLRRSFSDEYKAEVVERYRAVQTSPNWSISLAALQIRGSTAGSVMRSRAVAVDGFGSAPLSSSLAPEQVF